MKKQTFSTRKIALIGMMAALVFASNYARIVIPVSIAGNSTFTLANITCCLSGLLLGPAGGLASGIGSALYDLMNPRYAAQCWITFFTKGAMGLAAGLVVKKALKQGSLSYSRALTGAIAGCAVYYPIYFLKTFLYNGLFEKGLTPAAALLLLPPKIPSSIFNAAVAIIAAPPLVLAIRTALAKNKLLRLLDE